MQGRQNYQPKLFSMVQLEEFIPKGHLLRKIDRILDLGFVREHTKDLYCHDNGRPSIDPELFIRIQLLIYLYNISSDRKACEEVTYNMAYRWFCRLSLEDRVPDHSSLTKIRDRLGLKLYERIFQEVLLLCEKKGLLKLEDCRVMVDGTFIEANASLYSLLSKEEYELKEKKRRKIWQENCAQKEKHCGS